MPLTPLVIIGAGGFGREVLDVVDAINDVEPRYEVLGFLDDEPSDPELLESRSQRVLGPVSELAGIDAEYVIGIGSGTARRAIDEMADGRPAPILVHPQATIAADVTLGPGGIVTAGVRVTNHIRIGRHVHLNLNVANSSASISTKTTRRWSS